MFAYESSFRLLRVFLILASFILAGFILAGFIVTAPTSKAKGFFSGFLGAVDRLLSGFFRQIAGILGGLFTTGQWERDDQRGQQCCLVHGINLH